MSFIGIHHWPMFQKIRYPRLKISTFLHKTAFTSSQWGGRDLKLGSECSYIGTGRYFDRKIIVLGVAVDTILSDLLEYFLFQQFNCELFSQIIWMSRHNYSIKKA